MPYGEPSFTGGTVEWLIELRHPTLSYYITLNTRVQGDPDRELMADEAMQDAFDTLLVAGWQESAAIKSIPAMVTLTPTPPE